MRDMITEQPRSRISELGHDSVFIIQGVKLLSMEYLC
jgi:hypothetical protein